MYYTVKIGFVGKKTEVIKFFLELITMKGNNIIFNKRFKVIYSVSSFKFMSILFLCFMLVFVNNTLAQSNPTNPAEIEKLALKCSKGHKKSCNKLIRIANTDNYRRNRVNAVEKITDQNVIIDIAKNNSENYARVAAIIKVTDQRVLFDIAKNNSDGYARQSAINLITDQNVLADIALNDSDSFVRVTAINNITDQNTLKEIYKNETNSYNRITVVRKITDQNTLIDIYKNDPDKKVREIAVENLTDQYTLIDIYKNDPDISFRSSAFSNITHQNALVDIVHNGDTYIRQCEALIRLNENESYQQILDIINKKKSNRYRGNHNLAAIAALKIIPVDKYLKNNYRSFKINIKLDQNFKNYYYSYTIEKNNKTPSGTWRMLDFDIDINTNELTKSFNFNGKRGGTSESKDEISRLHIGNININEICEFLLSPLSKDDLLKISNESDVVYLRETAKRILQD